MVEDAPKSLQIKQCTKRGAALLGKATFCADRGYDDTKLFLKLDVLAQDYVIRLPILLRYIPALVSVYLQKKLRTKNV